MIVLIGSFEDKGAPVDGLTAYVYLDTTALSWVHRTFVITRDNEGNELEGSGYQDYIEWVPNPPGWQAVGGSDGLDWKHPYEGKMFFIERINAAPVELFDPQAEHALSATELLANAGAAHSKEQGADGVEPDVTAFVGCRLHRHAQFLQRGVLRVGL